MSLINHMIKTQTYKIDVFGSFLCGTQSVQDVAHLHGEDNRTVQRQEATRNASARVCHSGQGLSIDAYGTRGPVHSVHRRVGRWQDREHEKGHPVLGSRRRQDEQDQQSDSRCCMFFLVLITPPRPILNIKRSGLFLVSLTRISYL